MIGEQMVCIALESNGKRAFCISGCALTNEDLRMRLDRAKTFFLDGMLWQNDEMLCAGLGQKNGRRVGHMSMSGAVGSISAFRDMSIENKMFVHINNANPVLRPDAPEKAEPEAAGVKLGQDRMEIAL